MDGWGGIIMGMIIIMVIPIHSQSINMYSNQNIFRNSNNSNNSLCIAIKLFLEIAIIAML